MKKIIARKNVVKLVDEIRELIYNEIDVSKYYEEGYDEISEGIEETDIRGISNGFLSEVLNMVIGEKIEVTGEVEKLFPCPCCNQRTLTEPYNQVEGTGYEICPYCNWEDDGTTDIKSYRSINGGSIEDYRRNMKDSYDKYYISKWIGKMDSESTYKN